MKKLLYICFLSILAMSVKAQVPTGFNYQGIITDDRDQIIPSTNIDIEISITIGAQGSEVYAEAHRVMTSKNGIFSLIIGQGQILAGDYSTINWSAGNLWISTSADLDDDGNFELLGTSQFLSVPYAIHAQSVDNKDDADADPSNELQSIYKSGDQIILTDGGQVFDETEDADADPQNEIQNLNVNQNGVVIELGIDNGTGVTFGISDADADPSNELQTLSLKGDTLSISDGNEILLNTSPGRWQKRGDSVFINSGGSAFVESSGKTLTTEVSMWGITCNDSRDESILRARYLGFRPSIFNDNIGINYANYGIDMVKDSAGSFDPLMNLSGHGLTFHQGYLADYKSTGLSFGDSTAFVKTETHINPYHHTYQFGDNNSELSAYGLSISNAQFQYALSDLGLSITQYNGLNPPSIKWKLDVDSLTAYNTNEDRTVYLGNNSITKSGQLILNSGRPDERLFFLGDFLSTGTAVSAMYHNDDNKILSVAGFAGQSTYYGNNDSENITLSTEASSNGRGQINVHNSSGDAVTRLGVNSKEDGYMEVFAQDDKLKFRVNSTSMTYFGILSDPTWYVEKSNTFGNLYEMTFIGDNLSRNMVLGYDERTTNSSAGEMRFYNREDQLGARMNGNGYVRASQLDLGLVAQDPRVEIDVNENDNSGSISIMGSNGTLNFKASKTNQAFPNEGRMDVYDENGFNQAGMFVDQGLGYLYADVKNFRVDHPTDPTKDICYASIEGPEAAAYVRGTTRLTDGEAFIPFPEHFKMVANPNDLTVILTPMEWDTYGLAVIRKTSEGFYVKELKGGRGQFEFDWEAKCKRIGLEDYEPIKDKI